MQFSNIDDWNDNDLSVSIWIDGELIGSDQTPKFKQKEDFAEIPTEVTVDFEKDRFEKALKECLNFTVNNEKKSLPIKPTDSQLLGATLKSVSTVILSE